MSLKQEITAYVDSIEGVQPLQKGFKQNIVLRIPEARDEFETIVRREQFFRIEIWSNSQTDSRFLNSSHLRSRVKAVCHLNGERWLMDQGRGFAYNNKLKLAEWQKP